MHCKPTFIPEDCFRDIPQITVFAATNNRDDEARSREPHENLSHANKKLVYSKYVHYILLYSYWLGMRATFDLLDDAQSREQTVKQTLRRQHPSQQLFC